MAVIYDSWETNNQARRFPLREGTVFPFNLLTDAKIFCPSTVNVENIFINSIVAKRGIFTFSIKNAADNTTVLWAEGRSLNNITLEGVSGYRGYVTLGDIPEDLEIVKILSPQEGRLEMGVVRSGVSNNSSILVDTEERLTGVINLIGRGGISVSKETVDLGNGTEKVITVGHSRRINRLLIPDCAAEVEEFWARRGRQAILSVNAVLPDEVTGDIGFTIFSNSPGTNPSIDGVEVLSGLPTDRASMCFNNTTPPWRPRRRVLQRDICLYPECDEEED